MVKKSALDGLLGKLDSQINAEKPLRSNSKFIQDPLDMKSRMRRTAKRKARNQNIVARHNTGGTYNTETGGTSSTEDEDDVEIDGDLKDNLDFINENKFKTMDWTEPDGSKTTLKFDENGTLLGKTKAKRKSKSRPEKFSDDLKRSYNDWKAIQQVSGA